MKYLITCFLMLILSKGFAQQDTLHKNHKIYFALGFGAGVGTERGTYSDSYLSVQHKTNYIAVKASEMVAIRLFSDEPTPSISDVSVLVGKSYTFNRYLNVQFGTGIAFTRQISRGAFLYNTCHSMFCIFDHDVYETVDRRSIGLPLEIKSNFMLGRIAAFSVGLNANFNKLNTFCGISAGFSFGRLRDRIRKY
ncbi:hypothetical protein [Pedobacter punctiformis]|uniref:Outer membrane protein beta-barrel domain-containing protein n=1 Tax=Pedobacter punctiformis TaxID=3004097 RepID=A0ABT4LC50_9SPHI|nr:hypothetical protein [Pedobacter sp. HCMS5-2]MCZ4245484.1 hypothetical protein [Pedobacter sp. HCMS5-2]